MRKRPIIAVIIILTLLIYGSYIISSDRETDTSTPIKGTGGGLNRTGAALESTESTAGQENTEIVEYGERSESSDGPESPDRQIEEIPPPAAGEDTGECAGQEKPGGESPGGAGRVPGENGPQVEDDGRPYPEEVEVVKEGRLSLLDRAEEHVVKKGETLWGIAQDYNIDIDTIIGANDITNMNRIKPGDILKILPVKGIVYKVSPGESLWIIARQFKISLDRIVEANLIADPDLVKPGKILVLPGAKPEFGYQERLKQKLIKPVTARISSHYGGRWGRMHEGVDYAVNVGTPVKAASSGKVIYSGWATGYGKTVIIEHRKGLRTLYAHNSKLLVKSGEWVERGEIITRSGNTGNSTGPHLHFEVQINGKPVNPLSYIK